MSTDLKVNNSNARPSWEVQSPKAFRELAIKKVAFGALAALNLAGIVSGILYISIMYAIPTEALIISPFVVGVLLALSYLKAPTCGIHNKNYQDYLNPAVIFSRIVTTIFFGPVMLLRNWVDWTPYHDPFQATVITNYFKSKTYLKVLKVYGKNWKNLTRYGYLSKEQGEELKALYSTYVPLERKIDFLKAEKVPKSQLDGVNAEKRALEERWSTFKNGLQLPQPQLPNPDFSKVSARIKSHFRGFFCHAPVF